MIGPAGRRLLTIAVVVGCLGVLAVGFAAQPTAPEAWVFPGPKHLADGPAPHVGDRVEVPGVVQATDPLRIRVEYGDRGTVYTVTGAETDRDPRPGDRLRVYGVLESGRTIRSLNAFVVRDSGYLYAYVTSFLAGLWALGRLIRDWTVDPETLAFAPRDRPRPVSELVGWPRRAVAWTVAVVAPGGDR